jgi:hypothetical protein
MNFQKIEYQVADLSEAPQFLEINSSGQARYRSHTNETTPNLSEIGTYETTLSRNELQAIESLLGGVPLPAVPDHTGRVLSGEHYRRLRVTVTGGVIEKLVGTRQPVDAGLQRILNGLDQVINRVRTHPRRVLRIDVGVPAMKSAEQMAITIKLSSVGTEALACADPVLLSGSDHGWLSVEAWPSANSSALITTQPTLVEYNSPPPPNRTISILQLAPGASAEFRLLVPVAPVRGREYLVRIQYATTVDRIKDHEVIRGELFAQPTRLTVP